MKIRFMLDNYKIRTKLILIYIFCVVVPMVVTNMVMIISVGISAHKEQENRLNRQVEGISFTLNSIVDNCMSISNNLYTDKTINDFLDVEFEDYLDYYEKYTKWLRNNPIRFYFSSKELNSISVYADNKTLVPGGNIGRISSIKEREWYRAFLDSRKDYMVYVYYDNESRYIPYKSPRTVSFIRKLDYYKRSSTSKVLKMDINYQKIVSGLGDSQYGGQVYVCNGDNILFSNVEGERSREPFDTIGSLNMNKVSIKKDLNILDQEWEVYIFADKVNLWSALTESLPVIFILIIFNLLFPTIVITLVDRSLRDRIELTGEYMKKVKQEQFQLIECNTGEDEIGQLIQNYNLMVVKIKDLVEVVFKGRVERRELELAKKQAELKALQSQINPHFMSNMLESIRMRSLIKSEVETADILSELSILLRSSINWGVDNISVAEEMGFVENYLKLQKYRFGDKLTYYFHVSKECKEIKIPKLSIVTFVENACVHGIEGISRNGVVSVEVSTDSRYLYIVISDSGIGMNLEKLIVLRNRLKYANIEMLNDSGSTGMLNAFLRLKMHCNGNIKFEIDSEENYGTDITLQMSLE